MFDSTRDAEEPLTPDEEPEGRLRRIFKVVGWAIAIAAVPPLLNDVLGGRRWSALVLLTGEAGALIGLWLNARGRLRPAVLVLVGTVQACASALVVVEGHGLHDVAMMLFPATLVVAGLLLDIGAFAVVSAATVLVVLGVGAAELGGILVTPLSPFTQPRNLVDVAIILGVTATAVGLLANAVRTSLLRTREQARRLQASEERFRSLVELAVDGILIAERGGRVVAANQRMQELAGRTGAELVSGRVEDLFPPDEIERLPLRRDLLEKGETVLAERHVLRRDGTLVPVEMSSKRMPDGTYHSFFRDITERRRAEEEKARLQDELRHAQKMEAVGRLAGGIAHDLNNMLMVIGSSVAVALRDLAPGSRAHRCLAEVDQAAGRTGALTRQLLTFSRKQDVAPRVLDLAELVGNLRPMLAGIVGGGVTLDIDAPPSLGLVKVDAGQVEQALVNLAMNARDAMPGGGRLALRLRDVDLDGERALALGLAPGPCVELRVADTGSGMTPDVRQHAFEPFFTTKSAGAGTGLGLAMVYGAVKQNGGAIDMRSEPERGSTFELLFPRVTASSPDLTPRPSS